MLQIVSLKSPVNHVGTGVPKPVFLTHKTPDGRNLKAFFRKNFGLKSGA